jgi:hypothetical protein
VWQRDEDRSALASDALRASLVPDPVGIGAQTIDAAQAKDARVLVFSVAGHDRFTTDDLDVRCYPALRDPEALCVQARATTWHAPPPDPKASPDQTAVAAAYGPLPYWMSLLGDSHDPRVVDVELALVTFARRMSALGFTPGVIEGVTEKTSTVDILGRSGDDAVVAVGLWPSAPYAHPYTSGRAWKLDGEPEVIPLVAGARVSLDVAEGSRFTPASRRTVVFRHAAR